MVPVTLTLTKEQHDRLMLHLFPADGCEAVAFAVCGRRSGKERHRLLAQRIVTIPHEACSRRTPWSVTWPTSQIIILLEEARSKGLSLVKIHGHRDYDHFSSVDDKSDRELFPSIYAWVGRDWPHASAIVLADGRIFGRVVDDSANFIPLAAVNVVGDDLSFWHESLRREASDIPEFGKRVAQTFGERTYRELRDLSVAVIGCSGTGSVVIEQLARNGVGKLVLVDPDKVEEKNLNRILNSTAEDALKRRSKVQVARRAIEKMGFGTVIETFSDSLFNAEIVRTVASCDVVFGCMDTVDGRHILNKLSTFYLVPYFDLGVRIDADGNGGVDQVCGTVHYVQPGGSSLVSRGVYTLEEVRSAGLMRRDPQAYRRQLKEGYIRGVREDRPAVVQLNSLIASLAVNEFLARLHPYRLDPNSAYAIHRISLSHGIYEHEKDGAACLLLVRHVGRGDVDPPLDWAELSSTHEAA